MKRQINQARLDRRRMLADHYKTLGMAFVPCETCGDPTDKTGTKRCDGCWEVEHRLDGYVRDGGDVARGRLAKALYQGGEVRELSVHERHTWGECPICHAKHGEECEEPGAPPGQKGSHVKRLERAPLRVREVAVP